ncbi:MAG: hypothetical protein K1060chlam1_01488, partial [Candidatus Anoxychlamydiales bacterium]|nr:hypothetical protein [Candidatus Anoxychlamydiales bacterium]
EILDACSIAWNNFVDEKEAIKNLCTREWVGNFNS